MPAAPRCTHLAGSVEFSHGWRSINLKGALARLAGLEFVVRNLKADGGASLHPSQLVRLETRPRLAGWEQQSQALLLRFVSVDMGSSDTQERKLAF